MSEESDDIDPKWYQRKIFPPDGAVVLLTPHGRDYRLHVQIMREVYDLAGAGARND